MNRSFGRLAIAVFLPAAVLATLACGLVYAAVQYDLRSGANDPQRQMAQEITARLDEGASPGSEVSNGTVDLATSLTPFVAVYDLSGTVLATDGRLDGSAPEPPRGVLDNARANGLNSVTWQPRPGIRIATVEMPWRGGTVLVGRSLAVVEQREGDLRLLVGLFWLATLAALGMAALIAVSLLGARPGAKPERGRPADAREPGSS